MDRSLTERQWQKQVEDYLKLFGWWFMHVPANVVVCDRCGHRNYRGIARGFPDLLAIKPPFVRWIELKRERGWIDPDQRSLHALLRACGQVVLVARPRDREYLVNQIAHPEDYAA
jgi:hypothetical protein